MKALIFGALIIGAVVVANASELDNEKSVTNVAPSFAGTVVLRVSHEDKSTAILRSENITRTEKEAHSVAKAEASNFEMLPAEKVLSELDRDGGRSSWYFYWPALSFGFSYSYPRYTYTPGYATPYGYTYYYNPYGYSAAYAYNYAYTYGVPVYGWYGSYYTPYYSFSYGPYSYYYYGYCGFC